MGTTTTYLGAFPGHIGLEAFINASDWYAMWSTGLATITSYEIRNYADFWELVDCSGSGFSEDMPLCG